MTAKEIMEVIDQSILPEDTIRIAVQKMAAARRSDGVTGVKGLHVVDESGNLIAMVSMMDILKAVHPAYMEMGEDLSSFTWDGMLETLLKRIANVPVQEIMKKTALSVEEDAPLMKCLDIMLHHEINRLPVVGRQQKVTGVIYLRDLYYAVIKTLLDNNKGGK